MGTQLSKSRLKRLREKKVSYGTSRNSNSSNISIDRISNDSSGSNGGNRGNEDDIFLNRNGFTSIRKHLNSDINVSETYQLYIQHDLLREVWEGNFSSPIKKDLERGGIKVLNVGCGPGNWLCEMSSDYPKCFYMGVDNVELLPDNKPLNVMFIKHEFSQDLPFEDNTFDFVYMRLMIAEIAENRWEAVVKELVRVLKPGGWIELMEPNFDLKDLGPITKKINDIVMSKMKDLGMNPSICQRLEEYMRNTKSLVNINTSKKELFCGSSGGNLGEIAGTLIRNFYLKFMESSSDSIVNGILDKNNDNKTNNKNSSSIKNPASNYHNNNRSIGRIDNDSYGNSGRNRHEDRDGSVSELEKIMKNVAVELNIYKTYVENYRYIGRKIVPIFVPK